MNKHFQLQTGHGALFKIKFITERNHGYECKQLETVK